MGRLEEITPLIENVLAQLGLELFEAKFVRAGSRSVLRVFIDKDGGVTIDDCEKASRDISLLLDNEEFSNARYTLEVSSPGLDRPLTAERDFKRVIGERLRLRLRGADGKEYIVNGQLLDCRPGVLALRTSETETVDIDFSTVVNGKVEITF
jgi:ribosome maturation factor RimP